MKKNYLIVLLCAISSLVMGQTVEIVKDYYPNSTGFGATPTNLISNSNFIAFSGAQNVRSTFFGTTYFFEPFVSDGTAKEFSLIDLVAGEELGLQSNPEKFFVFNDEIYFCASDGTTENVYKINSVDGSYTQVTTGWAPSNTPKVVVETIGVTPTEALIFAGKNPNDSEDDNYYLLEWDGTSSTPYIALGLTNGTKNFNLTPVKYSTFYTNQKGRIIVGSGQNPDVEGDIGVEFFYSLKSPLGKIVTTFSDLAEGVDANGNQLSSYPENFTNIDNVIYFNTGQGVVYKFDLFGGDTAPVEITAINDALAANTTLNILGEYNGKLLIHGVESTDETSTEPRNVWIYDTDTEDLTPLYSGTDGQFMEINDFEVVGENIYLSTNWRSIPFDSSLSGAALMEYDGTTLTKITEGGEDGISGIGEICEFNGKIYFSGQITGANEGSLIRPYYPNSTHKELFMYDPTGTYYNITYNTDGLDQNNPATYTGNNYIELEGVLKDGFSTTWYTTSNFEAGTEKSTIEVGESGDLTLYATTTIIDYTIAYELYEGIVDGENPTNYTVESSELTLIAPTKDGYTFEGWYDNADFTGSAITSIVTGSFGDLTLHAKYSPVEYAITYNLNGGTNSENNPDVYTIEDADITLSAPTLDGYYFVGWFDNAAFTGVPVSTITTADMVAIEVFARYMAIDYTITYELDGGSFDGDYATTYSIESDFTLAVPTKDGFTFTGWYSASDLSGDVVSVIVPGATGDITLYASWTVATAIGDAWTDEVTVSPNPSSGYVNVTGLTGTATYEIYNIAGSLLEKGLVANGTINYSVSTGIYLLRLAEGNDTKVVRIIVK